MIVAFVLVLVEAHVVENEKLRFGAEVGGVSHSAVLQMQLGLLGDPARIALICCLVIGSITSPSMTSVGTRRTDPERGRRVGNQQHIALMIAAQPRMLEPSMPSPLRMSFRFNSLIG